MPTLNDVHQQFASFFKNPIVEPFAYLLSKRQQEGHICIHKDDIKLYKDELPYIGPFQSDKIANATKFVSTDPNTIRPFILHKDQFYLYRYFNYETQILQSIGRLLNTEASTQIARRTELEKIKGTILDFKAKYPTDNLLDNEKIDWQIVAAIIGVQNNFSIITGGPGTGKTTTVAKILALLFSINPNCRVALAAPTGKASMRMAESLKLTELPIKKQIKDRFQLLSPNTIHKLLKYIPDSIYFKHNQNNPLPYDVVIVDEASMIDVALFAKLLDAIGPNTRLILLGDKNQLASVEAGSLFGDLCKTIKSGNFLSSVETEFINQFIPDNERKISNEHIKTINHQLDQHIIELQLSHRFKSSGGIGKLSHAIINNVENALKEFVSSQTDPSIVIDTTVDTILFEQFIDGYRQFIEEADILKALKKLNDLRVLCAVRDGAQGLYHINKTIEAYLTKKKLINLDTDFYENRPIIITKNNHELGLNNGDIGIIRKDSNGNKRAWFEDGKNNIRPIMPGYINNAETVFAMTIHKSQGSEYNQVFVILPESSGNKLLTRELLYTAVTRAKQKVFVQTSETILLQTASGTVKRASGITTRFNEIK